MHALSLSMTLTGSGVQPSPVLKFYFVLGSSVELISDTSNWFFDVARTVPAGVTPEYASTAIFGNSTFGGIPAIAGSLSDNFNSEFYGELGCFTPQCGTGTMKFYDYSYVSTMVVSPYTSGVINDYSEFHDNSYCGTDNSLADYCKFYNTSSMLGKIGTNAEFRGYSVAGINSEIGDDCKFYDNSLADEAYPLGDAYFYNNSECYFGSTSTPVYLYDDSIYGGTSTDLVYFNGNASLQNGYAYQCIASYATGGIWNYPSGKPFFYYRETSVSLYDSSISMITEINFTGNSIAETLMSLVEVSNFYDTSVNQGQVYDANFYDDSYNNGTVNGNATFRENSVNNGQVTGNADVYYPSPNPIGGNVDGTVTYHGTWP